MGAFRALVVIASTFAVAAACSSFSDGGDPPSTPDAAVGDSSAGAESDADMNADGDAGADRGCANHPQGIAHFCDDFDHTGEIGFRWNRRFVDDGGVFTETDAAFSSPRALVTTFPNGANPDTDVWLIHDRDTALTLADKKRIVLSYMLRVDELTIQSPGYFHTSVLSFDPTACPGNNARAVELRFNLTGAYVVDLKGLAGPDTPCEANGNSHYDEFPAPHRVEYFAGGFRKVTVEIARESCTGATGPASLVVDIDGTKTTCKPLAIDPFTKGNAFALRVGAFAGAGTTGAKARFAFDDVKLDVE